MLPLVLIPIELYTGSSMLRFSLFRVFTFLLAWSLSLYARGKKWWVPLLYPLTFLHLLYMAWKSYGRVTTGLGIEWKDRVFK